MAPVTFTTRASLVAGNPENIGDVTDCLDKLLAGVNSVSDSQLASPAGGVWRTIHEEGFVIGSVVTAAGTYWFTHNGNPSLTATTFTTLQVPAVVFDASAYAVTGKTAQLRVNVNAVNGLSIGVTPTFGLYTINSLSNSGGGIALTLGSALAGSTVAVVPNSNALGSGQSSGFAVPGSTGVGYIFGVSLPGTTTSNGLLTGTLRVELSYT